MADEHIKITWLKGEEAYQVTAGGRSNKFCVGSIVRIGDCVFKPERGPWTATTRKEARQMAKDFGTNMIALEDAKGQ